MLKRLEMEAPEMIQISNKITGLKSEMTAEDAPILYLSEFVGRIEATGMTVSFSLVLEDKVQKRKNFKCVTVAEGRTHIEIPMRDGIFGAERANQIWSRLVFEIKLLEADVSLADRVEALADGSLDKDEFVESISRMFYDAAVET